MKTQYVFILTLFIVSFATRILFLDSIPEGFHHDEISVGYNAYSIVKTGKDEYGRKFPFVFEALEDYKLPIIVYFTAPFILLFGKSDFWVRFPTAIIGAMTPFALYFLTKKIINKRVAVLSAISLAISPWHILFSRSVNESTVSVFTAILGVYFLISLFDDWTFKKISLCLLFSILSIYTYRTQFIFMPLMIFSLSLLNLQSIAKWNNQQKYISLIGLVVFATTLFYIVSITGTTRVKDVGLPSSAEIRLIMEEQIREDGQQPPLITRTFHNKINNFLITLGNNYVSHFDPSYLFFTGDKKSSNNSTPFMGHLLFIDLPFLLLGLIMLIRKKFNGFFAIPLLWLLIGPIASTFTVDSPSALRNLISSLGFAILVGYGLSKFLDFFSKKKTVRKFIILGLIFIYGANFIFFLHQFSVHKRVNKPWFRDIGLGDMVKFTKSIQNNYNRIVFASYPDLYIFLLYYGDIDPAYIHNQQVNKVFKDRKKEIINLINPNYFVMEKDCILQGETKVLYVCIKDRIPKNAQILKSIRYADNQPAFTFLEFSADSLVKDVTKFPPGYSEYTENIQ